MRQLLQTHWICAILTAECSLTRYIRDHCMGKRLKKRREQLMTHDFAGGLPNTRQKRRMIPLKVKEFIRPNRAFMVCIRGGVRVQSEQDDRRRSAVICFVVNVAGDVQCPVRLKRDSAPAPEISRRSHEEQTATGKRFIQGTVRV